MRWQRGLWFGKPLTASRPKASGQTWRGTSVPADAYLQLQVPKYLWSLDLGKTQKEDEACARSDWQGEKRSSSFLHPLYGSCRLGGAFSCAEKGLSEGSAKGRCWNGMDLPGLGKLLVKQFAFSEVFPGTPCLVPAAGWESVPRHLWWDVIYGGSTRLNSSTLSSYTSWRQITRSRNDFVSVLTHPRLTHSISLLFGTGVSSKHQFCLYPPGLNSPAEPWIAPTDPRLQGFSMA